MEQTSPTLLKSASFSAILAGVLAIALLAFGLWTGAKFVDDNAQKHDERLVANGLEVRSEALRNCVTGDLTWDSAYKNIELKYNKNWIRDNIGKWFKDNCSLEQVYVFDGNGRLLGKLEDDGASGARLPKDIADLSAWLINDIRGSEVRRGELIYRAGGDRSVKPIVRSAIGQAGGVPSIAVAGLVQPDFSTPEAARGLFDARRPAPVVIGVGSIDQAYLHWLTSNYLVKRLRLQVGDRARSQGPEEAAAPIRDYRGRQIGTLLWPYSRVAKQLTVKTSPFYVILVLVLVGGVLTVVLIDRRQLEQVREAAAAAQEASLVKGRFIANLSHEIRTPMSGVLGILRLLQQKEHDPDSARLIGEAVSCGELLTRILNDILDFARLEEGRFELEPAACAADQVAREIVNLFRDAAASAGVAVSCEGADAPLAPIMIDKVRLRQILMNLVGNAVKFTRQGQIVVRLTQTPVAETGSFRLRFEVADTGPGMPAEVAARVFERFYQGDMRSTRRQGGSGLGLAICQSLVALMGGEIGVVSEAGVGSTFWFELPAPRAPAAADGATEAAGPRPAESLHVLVVEDNATNRLIAQRLLSSIGAEVSLAENGCEGVRAAEAQGFDAILMDIQMPEMDGVEAARAIRAGSGPNRATPIIGLTANVLDAQVAAYQAAGMNEVVAKPIDPKLLFGALEAACEAARPEASSDAA